MCKCIVTGERELPFSSSPFPAAEKLLKGATTIADGAWEGSTEKLGKGILQAMEGAGMATGAPVSALEEIGRIPSVGPAALLGRRADE